MDMNETSSSFSWSQLSIEGEKRDDLIIYQISLYEGLSIFGRGSVTLFSQKTLMTQDQLHGLLDKPAAISLLEKGKKIRNFVGKITGVTHHGIARVLNNGKGYVYKYELIIESVLSDMKYVRRTRSFLKISPVDVLDTILNYYNLTCRHSISAQFPKYDFFQRDETDESFFFRILRQFGLSFLLLPKAGDNPTQEDIVISDGNSFSSSADPEYKARLVLKSTENGFVKLSSWSMGEHTGVDQIDVDENLPGVDGARKKRIWTLNQNPVAITPDDTQKGLNDRIDKVKKNYLRSLSLNKTNWHGDTASLTIAPGGIMKVLDFYGQYTGDDSKAVKTRITKIHIELTEKLPGSFPSIPGASHPSGVNVHFTGIDMQDSAPKHMVAFAEEEQQREERTGIKVYRATVCDKSGSTNSINSPCVLEQQSNGLGIFFRAIPTGMKTPVRVTFSMPTGGLGQGLFHLPRIGDKIQIFSSGDDSFILLGYLPGNDSMQFMGKKGGSELGSSDQLSNVTALRHNSLKSSVNYLDTAAVTPYSEAQKDGIKYSEIGMYSGKQFADTDNPADDAVRVASTGDMFLQSNKDHVETAANFMFSTTDSGNALFSKFKNITFEAEGKITLKTGLSSIEISNKGIKLIVQGYARTSGALDTSFTLKNDSISSKAMKQSHSAIASYAASNTIGASLKLNGPTASLTGISTELNTMEKSDWVGSIVSASMLASMHIADVAVPHDPKYVEKSIKFVDQTPPPPKASYDWIKDLVESIVSDAWDIGMDIRSSYVKKNAWKFITQDAIWKYGIMTLTYSDKLSGAKRTEKISGQLWMANVVRNFLKLLLIYINIGKASSWKSTPSITLGYDSISIAAKEFETTADDYKIQGKKKTAEPAITEKSELLTAKNFFRIFAALPWKAPKQVAALTADQLKKNMAESQVFVYMRQGKLTVGCKSTIDISGKKKLSINAKQAKININNSFEVAAVNLNASFKTQAKIAASKITANSKVMMTMQSTNLKINGKAITQVEGGLVKMG